MNRDLLIRSVVAALALLGLAAFAVDWNRVIPPSGVHDTVDARLDGDPTQIKTQVAGYLSAVPVTDYSRVRQGALLFSVDDRDYRARADRAAADMQQAAAAVTQAEASVTQQAAQIDVAHANILMAEAEAVRARQERTRQAALLNTESYLARDWQAAVASARGADAAVEGARRALTAAETQTDVLRAQLAGARAILTERRAALANAKIQLGYTRIEAPFDGTTTARLARLGDYVAAGAALITIVPLQGSWAVANFREEQLRTMRPGQSARVTVDAVPGAVFAGHLDSIQPVSQAQGAALPPDRAAGNFTKIVQRVPVKVLLDPRPDLADRLRPGLSAEVSIDTNGPAPR